MFLERCDGMTSKSRRFKKSSKQAPWQNSNDLPHSDALVQSFLKVAKTEAEKAVENALLERAFNMPVRLEFCELSPIRKGLASAFNAVVYATSALFIKYDPRTVPTEAENLKFMNALFPKYFPKLVYHDNKSGIMIMTYYRDTISLHELIEDGRYPENVVTKVARNAYRKLFSVIYEGTMKEGVADPWEAHMERIYERIGKMERKDPEFAEFTTSPIRVLKNSKSVVVRPLHELLTELAVHLQKIACPIKVIVLGDEHPKNILVTTSPPYTVIFIDIPNLDKGGGDWTKGIGKVPQWLGGYGTSIEPLKRGGTIDLHLLKHELNFKVNKENPDGIIEIQYDLKTSPLAGKVLGALLEEAEEFAKRHEDSFGLIRLKLGTARAWLGGVTYHRQEVALIMLCEGLLLLQELVEELGKIQRG